MKFLAISYSKCKRRAASHQKVFLKNHLIYLKDLLAGGDLSVKSDILEAEAALRSLFDTELEGHKIRSRVKWFEEGEAPSAFFLKLENQKHQKHFTSSVWNLEGREVFSLPELMSTHEEFYSALFAEEPIDVEVQNCPMCLGLFLRMIG